MRRRCVTKFASLLLALISVPAPGITMARTATVTASFQVGANVINPTSCSIRASDVKLGAHIGQIDAQGGIMLVCTSPTQWNVRLDETLPASDSVTTQDTAGPGSAPNYLLSCDGSRPVIAKEELTTVTGSGSAEGKILEGTINTYRTAGQNRIGPCDFVDTITATVSF